MEVVIRQDATAVATFVADIIERLVSSRPGAVLGLATGSSPLGVYTELVRRHRAGTLAFGRATVFLLDEYIGLPPGHPASYRTFFEQKFSGLVDIEPGNVHVPDGACTRRIFGHAAAPRRARDCSAQLVRSRTVGRADGDRWRGRLVSHR